jgi:hypothetical protein
MGMSPPAMAKIKTMKRTRELIALKIDWSLARTLTIKYINIP